VHWAIRVQVPSYQPSVNGSETMTTLGNMGGITGSGANRYGRVAIIL
jgi:hypothetical protein